MKNAKLRMKKKSPAAELSSDRPFFFLTNN